MCGSCDPRREGPAAGLGSGHVRDTAKDPAGQGEQHRDPAVSAANLGTYESSRAASQAQLPLQSPSWRQASWPARAGLLFIWIYRHSLSLVMGRGCRYAPTCSDYTAQALMRFGLWRGGWVGLARILRCHPWSPSGFDPVPETLPARARWFLPWRYGQWTGAQLDEASRLG